MALRAAHRFTCRVCTAGILLLLHKTYNVKSDQEACSKDKIHIPAYDFSSYPTTVALPYHNQMKEHPQVQEWPDMTGKPSVVEDN